MRDKEGSMQEGEEIYDDNKQISPKNYQEEILT